MNSPAIGSIMFSAEKIQQKIAETGAQITDAYQGLELVVISVLKGSLYFLADLTRHINLPLSIDFLSIKAFPDETRKTGIVRFTKDLDISITDKHVLLVEDVVGTGLTLAYICQHLEAAKPASLKICTLFDDPSDRLLAINVDYRCFIMPNQFVVGYGLDYQEKYRNLPYIAAFDREKMT
ncbi:hypoxanthine phosphoribosyltransferase [Dehalobacter sp. DCM]|uniref:hypoxanthine phosphoribosyltransferase n=1 Tax=Dehalobacter sp. DCM TaxID=2907827 RepID=UPI003081A6E1|nr:hypoxanthine phosphoribosyltransferase [Dehalobacter sp. DCM]